MIDDVVLCVEEAATNAIRHSGSDRDVEISLRFADGDLLAEVKDQGRGFDLASFDREALPDVGSDHGRGLFIVAKLMDSLELSLDGGLSVRMRRRAEPRCEPPVLDSGLGERVAGGHDQREARTRALLEEIDEGFVALDWEYRYVFINGHACRLLGRPREELLGRTPFAVFSRLRGSELERGFRAAMELGRPTAVEWRSPVVDDWVETRIYPTPAGVTAYFRVIGERKRKEIERDELLSALRDSEERYRGLFESESDALLLIDHESGRVLEANPAAAATYGYATEELLGLTDLDLSAEPERTRSATQSAAVGENVAVSSRMHRRKDGTAFAVEMTGRLFSLQGRMVRVVAVRDVTARKRAEEALGRFELLAANSRDIILFMDRDGRIIEANAAAERAYGYTRDELLELTVADLRAAQTAGVMASQMAEADERGILFESLHRRRDGSTFPVEVSSRGATVGGHRTLVSVVRDISERKRAEEALRASEEGAHFLADVVERAEMPFGVGAPDGRLILFNEAFAGLTGYSRAELEERELTWATDLTPPEWREAEVQTLAQATAEHKAVRYEKEYLRKDGSRVPVELFVQPIFDAAGELVHFRSFLNDITEHKQAEETLRRSGEAARRAEERYRNLFNTLIEGFCVIEMIFDSDGEPSDYRFLEINQAFEEQTGLHDAKGKLMRELAPDHEQHWFDSYGKVALSGEPARFMAPAAALGRYYDVSAFRVGGPESRQVGILFNDISERHRVEEERQHLLEESQAQAEELQAQGEELRIQSEELQAHYDEQLTQRNDLLRESELRAGLNAIGQLLHSTLEPHEVMRRALAEATRALGIDAAAIELSEGDAWPLCYAEGLPVEAMGSSLLGEPVIARLVAHSGEALVLDDVAAHETVGPFATCVGHPLAHGRAACGPQTDLRRAAVDRAPRRSSFRAGRDRLRPPLGHHDGPGTRERAPVLGCAGDERASQQRSGEHGRRLRLGGPRVALHAGQPASRAANRPIGGGAARQVHGRALPGDGGLAPLPQCDGRPHGRDVRDLVQAARDLA